MKGTTTSTHASASQLEASRAGWRSKLATLVSAALLFLGLSGLWIYLGPFSVTSQLVLLGHVVVGLALAVPIAIYVVGHINTWFAQRATASMLLGYGLLTGVAVAVASGAVLTWQALFSLRLTAIWDLVHLITGFAVLGLTLSHVVSAFLRRRPFAQRDAEMATSLRGFVRRASGTLAAVVAVVLIFGAAWPETNYRLPVPADYTLPSYAQEFEEYRGNPFAPTFARTDDGQLVADELLSNSASCGTSGCHQEIYEEWAPSAHRFAAMNLPFQEVQRRFALDREPAETRYCGGCHDPISLFAGAKDLNNMSLSSPGVSEGISCVACHSISMVDQRGNADYVLTPPRRYLGENGEGARKVLSDFLIRAYPRQHLADYDRNLLRTPEYCGACHKQFIPEALNRFGMVEGQNQYDEWKNGHWHSDDPEIDLSCRDCHMRLVYDSSEPGFGEGGDVRRSEDDRAHRHHGFIATNNFMPEALALPGWERHVQLTNEWMRGETILPEIGEVWPEGPVASLDLLAPKSAQPGEEIEVRVVVANRKAGHNFITGPLDFVRSWIHLQFEDGTGEVIAEWGAIDPETRRILDEPGREHEIGNPRDEGTLVLEALPIDEHGNELREHELWKKAGGKGKRVIFPAYSDSHRYRLRIPEGAEGQFTIRAALNYRRYRQEFLDRVVPSLEVDSGVLQPTITQVDAVAVIAVEGGTLNQDRRGG